ncbi:MAG: hypothetical protein ACI4VM_05360 [Anaerovoracaceae bacterium]
MFRNNCECSGTDHLYRGESYDISRARLGPSKDRCCVGFRFFLFGWVLAVAAFVLISCAVR